MGHKTLLLLQHFFVIWASLFISLSCCHLLLALLLQTARPSSWMQMQTPMDISWGVYRVECMNKIAFVVHMPSDSCTAISLFKVFWLLKSTFFLLK